MAHFAIRVMRPDVFHRRGPSAVVGDKPSVVTRFAGVSEAGHSDAGNFDFDNPANDNRLVAQDVFYDLVLLDFHKSPRMHLFIATGVPTETPTNSTRAQKQTVELFDRVTI